MEIVFSIIIPIYNVEQYIVRCLDSIYSQNLDKNLFEVILVDDGSPDNSALIAQDYLIEKNNYKIIRQKNKGLGGARNTGINNSKGDYIVFLDADDVLAENCLEKIYISTITDITNQTFDIIELSANRIDNNFKLISKFTPNDKILSSNGIDYYFNYKTINSVCNKIYNLLFLNNNNLRFIEKIYSEDFEFNTRAFFYAKKVVSTNILFQNFVQTDNSITRSNNKQNKEKYINDLFVVLKLIKDFSALNSTKELSLEYFNERLSRICLSIIYQAFKYGYSRKEIDFLIHTMRKDGLYFLNFKIKLRNKNLFRILVNNYKFIFDIVVKVKNERKTLQNTP